MVYLLPYTPVHETHFPFVLSLTRVAPHAKNCWLRFCRAVLLSVLHANLLNAIFSSISAESLVTYAGERWDFIINANNNISNYWIKIKGLADCDHNFNSAHTLAILHYRGAEQRTPNSIVKYKDISSTGIVTIYRPYLLLTYMYRYLTI